MKRREFIVLMGGAVVAVSTVSYMGLSGHFSSEPEVVKPYGDGYKVVDGWVLNENEESIDAVRNTYDQGF